MKYIESSELPEGEKVYLKEDWFGGYRVVHPETSWRWTRRDTAWLIFGIAIALFLWFGINGLISSYKVIADNPCLYCVDCKNILNDFKTNWSVKI